MTPPPVRYALAVTVPLAVFGLGLTAAAYIFNRKAHS